MNPPPLQPSHLNPRRTRNLKLVGAKDKLIWEIPPKSEPILPRTFYIHDCKLSSVATGYPTVASHIS